MKKKNASRKWGRGENTNIHNRSPGFIITIISRGRKIYTQKEYGNRCQPASSKGKFNFSLRDQMHC